MRRYVGGDEGAAETLYFRHSPGLSRYLWRRLRHRDLVEESLQETFLRFFARAQSLLAHPRPVAWLFSVARNVSTDLMRRRRLQAATFSDLDRPDLDEIVSGASGVRPERRLQSREISRAVMDAVSRLPDLEREVFLLRTVAMLSFRDIARKVGAPLNTVLSRMHRAMKRIRSAMVAAGWSLEDASGGTACGSAGARRRGG